MNLTKIPNQKKIMKTKIPLILALLLTGVLAQAAPQLPLSVAVYDFKGDAEAASYGNNVTTLVTADLTTETNLVLVERAELTAALSEQAFGISGMVSSDAAAKIGQITGAKVLVAGQVIKTGQNHLIIVANIIGTETGRLFADKVEGAADNLSDLTSDLSRKIAQTISDQTTNLVLLPQEATADRLNRIIKNINGTNRPSISINIRRYGKKWNEATVEGELGAILVKAGFTVVDANSDRKPDVQITGGGNIVAKSRRGGLFTCSYSMDVKIQERRSGSIIAFDRQESSATDAGQGAATTAAQVKTVDDLAERILPLLAK
jgi:TolB-like protein